MNKLRFRLIPLMEVAKQIEDVLNVKHQKEHNGLAPSCLSCKWFVEKTEICTKWNSRPPARIIALSCADYKDTDDIPF